MIIFSILFAFLLDSFGIKFLDAFFFSVVGYGAHLFEDALVYKEGYQFLWPFSNKLTGLGLFPGVYSELPYIKNRYIADFFGIANTEVLMVGVVVFLLAILIRTYVEGPTWIRWYMPEKLYLKIAGYFNPEGTR